MAHAIELRRGSQEAIQNLTHLPVGKGSALPRLEYLTQLGDLCPFTEEQEKIFLVARKWEKINTRSLKIGFWGCSALAVAPAFLGCNEIQSWINGNPKNAAMMFIAATLYAGAIGMINYVCTGTFPDRAAMTSIQAKEEILTTKKNYEEMAYQLLDIYSKDQPTAKRIASEIDELQIRTAMGKYISKDEAEEICSSLFYAKKAVLEDQIDPDAPPLIKVQWENIELKRRIDRLS